MISASEAGKAGIAYVDIWDGFVDEEGQFSSQGSRLNAPRSSRAQTGLMKVMGVVWVLGVASALSSIGFGAITAFSALLFVARGWAAWPAFTAFAAAFIVTRLFLGHVADRFGGAKVALICVEIEALGLALIWLSPWSALALIGAALTGIGYSLVYPGFGVEAVRNVPAQSRGLAMGAYTAFLDVALGFGTPALGLVADVMGLGAAFGASMLAALGAAVIAAGLSLSLALALVVCSPGRKACVFKGGRHARCNLNRACSHSFLNRCRDPIRLRFSRACDRLRPHSTSMLKAR
jgi:MFS family permease